MQQTDCVRLWYFVMTYESIWKAFLEKIEHHKHVVNSVKNSESLQGKGLIWNNLQKKDFVRLLYFVMTYESIWKAFSEKQTSGKFCQKMCHAEGYKNSEKPLM